ncbi:MAG: hypothetical protein ABH800_00070 [Candidatus Nealsonbacteria bacterium]
MITERQSEILKNVVREYINSAQPVSSQLLEKKRGFSVCPATIRSEMQRLTDKGYLLQPYTSAGRVPTDKGYRFFVDDLVQKKIDGLNEDFNIEIESSLKIIQSVTRFLASESSNLALGYLFEERILWKEGWEEILQEPEFKESEFVSGFTNLLREFEEKVEDFKEEEGIKIYIGRENPFRKSRDFSAIITRCFLPNKEEGVFAILGPTRMNYEKNIGSLNYLIKFLEEN